MEVGQKLASLTYLKYTGYRCKRRMGLFECECGKTKEIVIRNVETGNTKSCGCKKTANFKKTFHKTKVSEEHPWDSFIKNDVINTKQTPIIDIDKQIQKLSVYKHILTQHFLKTNNNDNPVFQEVEEDIRDYIRRKLNNTL